MTAPIDPFELLRAANPVDNDMLPSPARSITASALYEKITGYPYAIVPPPNRATRRRWRLGLGALVAAGGIGGGVAWAIVAHHPDKVLTVVCYAHADLSDGSVIATDGRDPIAVCADAWRAGKVGPTSPQALAACVLRGGTVGVFPADGPTNDPCVRLGLPSAAASDPAQSSALAALRSALADRFRASCVSLDQAGAMAVDELARRGLTGWTVTTVNAVTPERRCASVGVDEVGHRIMLIPVPG